MSKQTTLGKTLADHIGSLTVRELRELQDMWLDDFHKVSIPEGGNAQRWFQVVVDFLLNRRGDDIVPLTLKQLEFNVIEKGLSQEYMSALAATIDDTFCKTEYDKAVFVLTASPEERMNALELVLGYSLRGDNE